MANEYCLEKCFVLAIYILFFNMIAMNVNELNFKKRLSQYTFVICVRFYMSDIFQYSPLQCEN